MNRISNFKWIRKCLLILTTWQYSKNFYSYWCKSVHDYIRKKNVDKHVNAFKILPQLTWYLIVYNLRYYGALWSESFKSGIKA